jgi:hypothetical protein
MAASGVRRLPDVALAEADGNRTRQAEILGFTGFEDREGHQAPVRLPRAADLRCSRGMSAGWAVRGAK